MQHPKTKLRTRPQTARTPRIPQMWRAELPKTQQAKTEQSLLQQAKMHMRVPETAAVTPTKWNNRVILLSKLSGNLTDSSACKKNLPTAGSFYNQDNRQHNALKAYFIIFVFLLSFCCSRSHNIFCLHKKPRLLCVYNMFYFSEDSKSSARSSLLFLLWSFLFSFF